MSTKQQKNERQRIHNKIREVVPALGYDGTVALLDRLHRYEATLSRINDNDANGHPRTVVEVRDGKRYEYSVEDTEWAARDAKKEAGIQATVRALLEPLGIEVQFNGDPRGGAIRMLLPDHTSNGWDGGTWGIYW